MPRRRVLFVQLPIPQPGLEPARGNVPLAAGYLWLYARRRGLERDYAFEILPPPLANSLGDLALVDAILAQDPWMVGFTCYLWNIDRTLWIAGELKARRPDLRIIVGGPEITADNRWVLESPAIDFAAIGEGEQTFAELLGALREDDRPERPIAGLYVRPADESAGTLPAFRTPLPQLNEISSPYLDGLLDAADEQMLLLETIRGCIFKCKFCYYPKSYDDLYFLSEERIVANLNHARERGAKEVVLLDPTLNQRRDFAGFVKLLAKCNPGRTFTYFGELRAEGINPEIAGLLKEANFTEVEIGLQSVDPAAQLLMDRRNNMHAFERGVRSLMDAGIQVKVDLIIGLPGDTVDSIRRSFRYLRTSGLYHSVQVFNLAVLPGTAFRQEAAELGLQFQPRPPYYVLRTPTLQLADLYSLMDEAEETFDTEFDALPPPVLPEQAGADPNGLWRTWQLDLDRAAEMRSRPPAPELRAQAFTLWLSSRRFDDRVSDGVKAATLLLADNPHTTLQVVLDPGDGWQHVTRNVLDELLRACLRETSYLDRYYGLLPGRMKGAKRLVVLVSTEHQHEITDAWIGEIEEFADVVWCKSSHDEGLRESLEECVAG